MKPSQTAQSLRRIASKIQNSKNPDRILVARDLKKLLAAVAAGPTGMTVGQVVALLQKQDQNAPIGVGLQDSRTLHIESVKGILEIVEDESGIVCILDNGSEIKSMDDEDDIHDSNTIGPDGNYVLKQ
jgi:hypothetical protein